MKNKIIYWVGICAMMLLFAACNENKAERATHVELEGMNATGEEVYITIGSRRYDTIPNNNTFSFDKVLTYFPGENNHLYVTGKSGKEYLNQPLKEEIIKQRYPFVFVGDKDVFNPPAAPEQSIMLGFLLADRISEWDEGGGFDKDAKFDIVMRAYIEHQGEIVEEEEIVFLTNVPLREWTYKAFTPPTKGLLVMDDSEITANLEAFYYLRSKIHIYHAGTREPAFYDSDYDYGDIEYDYIFKNATKGQTLSIIYGGSPINFVTEGKYTEIIQPEI